MKIRKLIKKAQSVFDAEDRKTKVQKKNLKDVIKKLRKHEKALLKQQKEEKSKDKSAKLDDEINLAHAQRKKALGLMKELKKQ